MKITRSNGLILKIDYSKADDSVDWSCFFHAMRYLNLGEKWISWIKALKHSPKFSVIVNGSPTEEFSPIKGLRQGDPLAPYLFLIVAKILGKIIIRARDLRIIKSLSCNENKDCITHFQYADDTILFMNNSLEDVLEMKKILLLIQVITGLAINFDNGQIFHHNNDRVSATIGMEIMGCQFGEIPFKYLGVWVGAEKKSCKLWNNIKVELRSKLEIGNVDILTWLVDQFW